MCISHKTGQCLLECVDFPLSTTFPLQYTLQTVSPFRFMLEWFHSIFLQQHPLNEMAMAKNSSDSDNSKDVLLHLLDSLYGNITIERLTLGITGNSFRPPILVLMAYYPWSVGPLFIFTHWDIIIIEVLYFIFSNTQCWPSIQVPQLDLTDNKQELVSIEKYLKLGQTSLLLYGFLVDPLFSAFVWSRWDHFPFGRWASLPKIG